MQTSAHGLEPHEECPSGEAPRRSAAGGPHRASLRSASDQPAARVRVESRVPS